MPVEIVVPRLGWSMEEGILREWLVKPGAEVQPGDVLFVLETDKAAQEVESFDGGVLAIPDGAPAEGDKVTVGQLLGYLLVAGEATPVPATARVPAASPATPPATPPSPPPQTSRGEPLQNTRRRGTPITPRARRKARELGIDPAVTRIQGSGRGGRVRERDILNSVRPAPQASARTLAFMTARAAAEAFDLLAAEISRQRGEEFSRRPLMERLLKVALREHPALMPGETPGNDAPFGLTDFTERRVEFWIPEVATSQVAALGIGRVTGNPHAFPLSLSFDPARLHTGQAAAFLDRICELIETPVLALVL